MSGILIFSRHVEKLCAKEVIQVIGCITIILLPGSAFARGLSSVIDNIIRGAARVPDNIPIKKADDLVEEISKSRAAREAVDAELRRARRVPDGDLILSGPARSDEVLRLLRMTVKQLDPEVLRHIEKLDAASREAALILAKGGDELAKTIPDLGARARLLREGGAETVAAVGIFGPDAARSALRLDEAIRGGRLVVKEGTRAVTVADFGKVLTRMGDAAWKFWQQYVLPHWKIWLASGALAAYLVNPEYFQDLAGNLTEEGFRRLTEFAGEVAARAIRGVGQGSGPAVEKVNSAIWETYFNGIKGIYAAVGTAVVAFCILLLLFPRLRIWLWRPFQWLRQVPK
ncbi:MAG: hypothetical protein RML93_07550 [Anaerolineales bacterium]|nr:hypothetical protein [Anaerolineales bacterium]MDW8447128.1 hypothetical protein [Anaerolineales bacterium]